MNKNIIIVAVLVVLVGTGLYWFSGGKSQDMGRKSDKIDNGTAMERGMMEGKNSIVLNHNLVMITLEKAGFMVTHESKDGKPGAIMYASPLLTAGQNTIIAVTVDMKKGQTYYLMLHSDNGDKKFNASDDQPVKGSNGSPIMTKITVQ